MTAPKLTTTKLVQMPLPLRWRSAPDSAPPLRWQALLMALGAIITVLFAAAALAALVGTNGQARLSRGRLLTDPDPLIVEAGHLWTPPPRWLSQWSGSKRRRRAEAEKQTRQDPDSRYDLLCAERFAWNAIETSVARAIGASVVAIIALFAA